MKMSLIELLSNIKEGDVAKATFARTEEWFVTMSTSNIRYCNYDGSEVYENAPLTFSNIKASYEILNKE